MSKYEMDLTKGNLAKNMLIYIIPLMFSGILQLLYNAFDIIVLGNFSSNESMAAVSSTGSLVSLFVNLFLGISVGSSVVMAKYYGANDYQNGQKTVHTTILISIILGVIVSILGVILSPTMLKLSNASPTLIDRSSLYLKIYFGGIIFNIIYNFGASLLRSVGDTKRPLIFLIIAGILNVLLNVLFVVVFKLDVAGVALGTIISEAVSALLVIITLIKSDNVLNLSLSKLKIDKKIVKDIFLIGLPAGLQSVVFNVSNVIIQSKINGFADDAIAANGVASNLEGFIYVGMNAVYQATIAFTSQNYGAGKISNIKKILILSYIYSFFAALIFGGIIILFPEQFCRIYMMTNPKQEVINYAVERLLVLGLTYFICGFMDCTSGVLRGIGYSTMSMILTIVGIVGFRITWIYTFFTFNPTLFNLYLSYPISWSVTWIIELIVFIIIYKKIKRLNLQYSTI